MSAGHYRALPGQLLSTVALGALLAVTPALAQPALAQDAATPALEQPDDGLFTLLGRIILGTGTAKVAIDTPQAVTVLEQQDFDRAQPATVGDLLAAVPGVQAAGASARALGQAFNIRGIGNTEQTASEARIIVTVDGAPKFFEQYRMGSFFGDLELFKRVEVLRGPASSTLYGSGAIGGVVNFTTKDAGDFLADGSNSALRFKLGGSSNGGGASASTIFATRVGENAEFLGALNWGTSGDLVDGAGVTLGGSAYDRMSGLAKGRFTFGNDADQSLTLSVSRSDSDLDDTAVAQTGGGSAVTDAFGTADVRTVDDTLTIAYGHDAVANPLVDLDVVLSYTDTAVDKSGFSLGAFCSPGTFQVLCDNSAAYSTLSLKVENTAEFSLGAWQSYVTTGVQLQEQERAATSSIGALAFHPEGTDTKLGVYAQGEFIWNDRLTLTPGLRVDFGDTTPGASAAAAGATAQNDTAVSPKLAALYTVNDNWGVFGSAARTERMPTLDELYSSEAESFSSRTGLYSSARLPSLNLEKETATTLELGATYRREGLLAAGDSLQLKGTAFHNDVDNLIGTTTRLTSTTPGVAPVAYYSNIRAAEIWGAELEASYDAEGWFAQLAYSNVRSKDKDTGLMLADTPAENVALTLGAKLQEHDTVLGWRGHYYDAITTASATTSGASHDTHDIFLTWSPDEGALAGIDLNLAVENVFDSAYRNNLSQDNAAGRNVKITLAKTLDW